MANEKLLDLYSDYLISGFGQTTATGLSALLNGEISHDSVQRYLAGERPTSDHSQERNVKGINLVTCLYHNAGIPLPVGFELIAKTEHYTHPKDGKEKRRSPKTKNEYYREMTQQAARNQIQFKYVLNDVWFSAAENMNFVITMLKKDFVMPLKDNRKVTVSLSAKRNGHYQSRYPGT